jgi:tetratricopeptide (TPR) repeat protein
VIQGDAWLAVLDALYRGNPARSLQKLDAALQRTPLEQLDPLDIPYLDLAYAYAAAGRTDRARALLASYEAIDPTLRARDEGWFLATRGAVSLREGHPEQAVRELKEAIAVDICAQCSLPELGRAFEAAGESDSAIAAYERYLATPAVDKIDIDQYELQRMYRGLGELYEQKGDRARALDYYGRFVELWRDADPDLQPQVTEIRQRMANLAAQEGR